MKRLQGTWTVTALEAEGIPTPAGMLGRSRIIVKGKAFVTEAMGAAYRGTLTIDESRAPHRLDLLFGDGPHQGKSSLGIYKLDGDTWTICLGYAGLDRPQVFATSAGSGHVLETLTRGDVNVTAQGASVATAEQPVTEILNQYPDEIARLGGEWSGVSIVINGQPLPAQFMKTATRVANGNELTVRIGGQVQMHTGFTVDPGVTPAILNYFTPGHPEQGATMLGIYQLKGDALTTCFAGRGMPRPKAFESVAGDGLTCSVWRRKRQP